MSSKSSKQTTDQTTNVAVDRRLVQEQGQQIVDSIVYDTSSKSLADMVDGMQAQWATMVRGNSMNLHEVTSFGERILKLVDEGQVRMNDLAYQTLKDGAGEFRDMLAQGELVVDLADDVTKRSFDLAGDSTSRALDLVADVKTGDFSKLSTMVMIFALAAIWLSKEGN